MTAGTVLIVVVALAVSAVAVRLYVRSSRYEKAVRQCLGVEAAGAFSRDTLDLCMLAGCSPEWAAQIMVQEGEDVQPYNNEGRADRG